MTKHILLSSKEQKILERAIFQNVNLLKSYSLEYKDGLKICIFLEINFDNNEKLIITTGKYADNILLLDEFDFLEEKKKYGLQDGVELKVSNFSNDDIFEGMKGQTLLEITCTQKPDEDYYWQVNFIFETKSFIVRGLIDELEFSMASLQ